MRYTIFLDLITPIVMLIVGYGLKRHPRTEIGSNGYSTPSSRKSQKAWDFAQSTAPAVFVKTGWIFLLLLIIMNTAMLLLGTGETVLKIAGWTVSVLGLAQAFIDTERRIKNS